MRDEDAAILLGEADPVEGSGDVPRQRSGKTEEEGKRKKRRSFTPDDIGNGERIVAEHGEDLRFNQGTGEWCVWDSKTMIWRPDEVEPMRRAKLVARSIVKKASDKLMYDPDDKKAQKELDWGHKSSTLSRLTAMLTLAESEDGMGMPDRAFDANPALIATPNGTLELNKSGPNFRASRKEDLLTKVAGVPYIEGATHPMWNEYLDLFLPEQDLREWVQKLAGYSLYGANPERRFIFAWGPTSSGKTTFAELMMDVLGAYAGSFMLSQMRENQDERARADIVSTLPLRVIVATEASSDWYLHSDMIKRAAGNDRVKARLPHRAQFVERVPSFTPWVVTNGIPTINGADSALHRRISTALFPHTVSKADEEVNFRKRLRESRGGLEAVFAWIIEGWGLYTRDGLDTPPLRIEEATAKMREEFSDLDRCLAQICEYGPAMDGYVCSPADLYEAYVQWHDMNNGHQRDLLTGTAFGRALTARGYAKKQIKEDIGDGKRKVVWRRLGLRLRTGAGARDRSGIG